MHYRLIVTTQATDRCDAIGKVKAWLDTEREESVRNPAIEDENADYAYTHKGFWDWYVIGGRWSGDLMMAYIPDFWEQEKVIREKYELPYFVMNPSGDRLINQEKAYDEIDTLWKSKVPLEYRHLSSMFRRDQYKSEGCDDDVLVINKAVLDYISVSWNTEPDQWGDLSYKDLDGETPNDTYIGNRWAIVVDYHN